MKATGYGMIEKIWTRGKNNKRQKENKKFNYLFFGIVAVFSSLAFVATAWAKKRLDVSIEEIMFTLGTPLKDNGGAVVKDGVMYCLPVVLAVLVIYLVWVYIDVKKSYKIKELSQKIFKNKKWDLQVIVRNIVSIVCSLALIGCVANFYIQFGVIDYITLKNTYTEIYEEYYVKPDLVEIKAGKAGTKNLICIYLESMETMYASKEVGGNQETNLIPNLTGYADENISFSNSEKLGGFYGVTGTTWTIGSLFATTSGVPLKGMLDKSEREEKTFASGVIALGDILEEKGYVQEFLCGSDGDYAGRATYFKEHGNYKIFDLYSAREKGYIPNDYYVWWGYEDKYLYEIAKDELLRLSKSDKSFNFTMLTVDTHYPDGYVCELCEDKFDTEVENVIMCADKQLDEFIKWCKEQDFYEDTVIVMLGDHPRMDVQLMDGVEKTDRTMYNCIINSDKYGKNINSTNRIFSPMDMFPTILSAMGFEIEGERLGLGTNLFSTRPTLMEELGEEFLSEIGKNSEYYEENFQ